jgi:hypothetical protein
MPQIGKVLILLGIVMAGLGVLLLLVGNIPLLGRLPGDIVVRKKNLTLHFPLASSLLVSLGLSLILFIISPFFRK